jgi:hypothetical protein
MPTKTTTRALAFVDAHGGAFAVLAAAIARRDGRAGALAATTSAAASVPPEIAAVLAEVSAEPLGAVLAAALPRDAERIDLGGWGLALHEGEGDLERLALARIARDRIERRLETDRSARSS